MILTRDLDLSIVRRCFAEDVRFRAALRSERLQQAFAAIPRERYFGPGPWSISDGGTYVQTGTADPRELYHDVLVAIDPARQLNSGHPSSLAGLIDLLDPQPGERVFHLGCGLGYYTAVLAWIVGKSGRVVAVEIDADLAAQARANLEDLTNVEVVCVDGITYDPGVSDVILINAGVTHPQRLWIERLSDDGRMVVPMTFVISTIGGAGTGPALVTRRFQSKYEAALGRSITIYSSDSGRRADYNQVLGRRFREIMLGECPIVKSVRLDMHDPNKTCWLHGSDFCISTEG